MIVDLFWAFVGLMIGVLAFAYLVKTGFGKGHGYKYRSLEEDGSNDQ
jgi:hypothetical protein